MVPVFRDGGSINSQWFPAYSPNVLHPDRLWGEQVIQACLEQGTHLLDLSGELHFNESMRNKYHQEAKQKGLMIPRSKYPVENRTKMHAGFCCGRRKSGFSLPTASCRSHDPANRWV